MPLTLENMTVRGEVTSHREITVSRMDMLMASGIRIGLHVCKAAWTAKPEPAEFGMKAFPEIFKPGRMMMLPDAALRDISLIESRARAYLDSRSHYSTAHLSGFRFVHIKHAEDTILELADRRKAFLAAVDKLIEGYDEAKGQMKEMYFASWDKMGLDNIEATNGKRDEFWARRLAVYPTPEQIRERYSFFTEMTQTKFPEALESIDFRNLLRDQAVDAERQKHLEEEINYSKQQMERQVTEFVQSTVRGLRGQVVEIFQDLQKKVSDGEPLNKKNITSVREILEHVRDMDFLDDVDFKRRLDEVEHALGDRTDYNDDSEAAKALSEVLGNTIKFVTQTTDQTAVDISEHYFSRKLNFN